MADKRTVLITGCSDGGLGSALALAFQEKGWRVFATARNLSKLKETEAAGIESIQLDVTSPESLKICASKVQQLTGGSLDALVNNAGAGYTMPILDLEIDKVKALFDLNVFSVIAAVQAFVPLLIKSVYGGMVINHSSISSGLALPIQSTYNASKAAASMFTQGMRLELEPFGIRVIDLKSGSVNTTFFGHSEGGKLPPSSLYNIAKEDIEQFMTGEEVMAGAWERDVWADSVVGALGSKTSPYVISKGANAWMAWFASWLPIGSLDGPFKKMTKLDVVAQRVKEQGGVAKLKVQL